MRIFSKLANRVLRFTPYELRRRECRAPLPDPTFENVRLAAAYYLKARPMPTLVQVGACDGTSGDPIHPFIRTGGMRAILVEPIEDSFQKLQRAYEGVPNITTVQAAISTHDGFMRLFKVKPGAKSIDPYWGSQLASFDRAHLVKHRVAEEDIQELRVPCMTLGSLIEQCGISCIDILQVDTEGFDAEIVKMALRLPNPPECINFESVNLSPAASAEAFAALAARGYVWTHDDWNTLAIHRASMERWQTPAYSSETVAG